MHDGTWGVEEVRGRVLRHEIAAALRAAIQDRRLQPGERILEADLARRFGVSRQPVREAIRELEREGLLTCLPNRGTFVTRVSVADALAVCDVRAELEGLAARLAVRNLSPADCQRLRQIPDRMRAAAERRDLQELITLDLELHDLVIARANHSLLQRVLASIAVYSRGFIVHTKTYYGENLLQVAESHQLLVDELLTLDPARAEAAVQKHIAEAAERLRRLAREQGDRAPVGG